MLDSTRLRASTQTGTHPRPQLLRADWLDLSGEWGFRHDDDALGLSLGWHQPGAAFDGTIVVPYPPEAPLSGVADTAYHPVVWYRRMITPDEVLASGRSEERGRTVIHFGAVDYRAEVWIDGRLLGRHEGGHTPFSFDVTDHVSLERDVELVVRAEDDPHDVGQPRGKQDWLEHPHVIWYHRTTGIWQPVWLESVPDVHVRRLGWSADVEGALVHLDLELGRRPASEVSVTVELSAAGRRIASVTTPLDAPRTRITLPVPDLVNGQHYETLLWTPERPNLIDARIAVVDAAGHAVDEVASYLGLRSVGEAGGRFLLNDRPVYLRSVLEQGWWPESHLAAPSAEALRDEVQLIKDLGFNAARVHQKVEDPRFLYWADRLGLMLWGEMPSPFEYTETSAARVTREWIEVVQRDRSHPSIITWVPLNESWGVQHIAHDPAQLDFARALYHLTRALDPTRPVVSNDGWEHAESDLLTIHDYEPDGDVLRRRYGDEERLRASLSGMGPAGRRLMLLPGARRDLPVMVTEFGGVTFAPGSEDETWGYSVATSPDDLERRLGEIVGALLDSPALAGFCYTQLTDTMQEANGLCDENRRPKIAAERIRAIVRAPHAL